MIESQITKVIANITSQGSFQHGRHPSNPSELYLSDVIAWAVVRGQAIIKTYKLGLELQNANQARRTSWKLSQCVTAEEKMIWAVERGTAMLNTLILGLELQNANQARRTSWKLSQCSIAEDKLTRVNLHEADLKGANREDDDKMPGSLVDD